MTPVTSPVTLPVTAETHTLERLIDVLQRELEAARERETLLLQMLSQQQQQNQRLLDMPRETPAAPAVSPETPWAPRGAMRQRIVALLQDHPEGLKPAQVRQLLGADRDLGATMKAMTRDGLLRRLRPGQYGV